MPYYYALIPQTLELIGAVMGNIAITMTATSVYQMLWGLVVFVVALLSVVILRRRYHRHHWTGLGLILGGIIFVGWGGIWASERKGPGKHDTTLEGILLLSAG